MEARLLTLSRAAEAGQKIASAIRVAVVAYHPVQYHTPLYRTLNDRPDVDLTVLYLDRMGLEAVYDKSINAAIVWDIPLLDGYRSAFLQNYARNRVSGFMSRINPGLFEALSPDAYDVVLINGYATASAWFALAAAKRNRLGVVWRGEVVSTSGREENRSLKHKIRSTAVRRFFRSCDTALYTCTGNRRFLEEHGWTQDHLFPFLCAVDNGFFREGRLSDAAAAVLRAELGVRADQVVVTFCGRLSPGKRTHDIVKAIAKADARRCFFLVVGDGPERSRIVDLARELGVQIHVTGFVNQSMLAQFYSITDIAALASDVDRSPKFINEVMNFNVPIIVSDGVGTADDLAITGETGFVFKVGDVDALSRHLSTLLDDPERRQDMGLAAAELVGQFTFDAEVDGLLAACRAAVKRRAAR